MNTTWEPSEEFEKKSEEIDKRVRDFIGKDCHLSYSAYEYDDKDNPIDNLDEFVAEGYCVFIRTLWGDIPFISDIIEDPTWLDVCKIANDSILYINPRGRIDHIYLESANKVGALDHGRIKIFEMHFGS